MLTKKITRAGLTGAMLAGALAAGPMLTSPALAAGPRDGSCDPGEFCLYYNSNQQGSVSDFTQSVPNYGDSQPDCYEFRGPGLGKDECVKNEAASVWNRMAKPVTVYFHSNYGGASQTIAPGAKEQLRPGVYNENASHRIGDAAPPPTQPPGGSYGVPNVNPHPSVTGRAPNPTPRTQFVKGEIERLTGERDCYVGDYRSEHWTSNHNTGNALDCTISSRIGLRPTAEQKAQGDRLANWLKDNADRLQVRYVMWDGKIWSKAKAGQGWRPAGSSNVTLGHYDHIHVSIQNPHGDGRLR